MGFKLAELFVPIRVDMSMMSKGLGLAHRSLLGLAAAGTRTSVSMRSAFIAIAGTAAPMGYAVKQAIELEHQYAQIRKTTGLMGDDFARLKAELQAMATTMAGVSLDEINGIAEMAGRLGIQGVEGILSYTKAIASIKIALDDIPAEEAATSIARILNNFQLGPEYALSFASALNKLDDSSTATGRDILDMAQRLSGTASTLGMMPQKVLALAAALKDAGVENEVGGSAFSQIFAKMATDTKDFAKVAGLSLKDFTAKLRKDPLEAVKAIVAGLAKMDQLERFKALDQLGLDGVRTSGSLLQLSNVIGRLDGMVGDAQSEWQSHASILREVGVRSQETGAQLTRLWNNVRLTAAGVGDLLLPVIRRLADTFGELSTAVRNSVDAQDQKISPWIQDMIDHVETLGVVWRNWGDIVELTVSRVAGEVDYAQSVFASFINWFKEQWTNMFVDAINTGIRLGIDNLTLAPRLFEAALKGIFGKPIDFQLLPRVNAGNLKLEKPKLPPRNEGFALIQQQIEDRMAAREAKRLDDKAKRAREAAKAPDPQKPPEGNGKAPDVDKKGKDKGATTEDLSSYVRRLAEGVFGKDGTKKTNELLTQGLAVNRQILAAQLRQPRAMAAVAVGPE